MREIRFRAWDIENKIMYWCITDIHWEISGKAVRCSWCTSEIDDGFLHNTGHCVGGNDNFILEQYTGLKDKNGVEIYEGDVLDTVEGEGDYYPNRVKVEYHALAFMFVGMTKDASPNCEYTLSTITNKAIDSARGIEVISNIHEDKT